MMLVASILRQVRTAVIAALVFALLAASLTVTHALPCPDSVTDSGASLGSAVENAGAHSAHEGGRKAASIKIDQCCQMSCTVCVGVVPSTASEVMAPALSDHPPLAGIRLAGITAGPPHGPPRR
jgi:hypothetical protein